MENVPNITNEAVGDPRSTTSTVLETGAAVTQVADNLFIDSRRRS